MSRRPPRARAQRTIRLLTACIVAATLGAAPAGAGEMMTHIGDAETADAEWLVHQGIVASYYVQHESGAPVAACTRGHGILVQDDEGQPGRCGGTIDDQGTAALWFDDGAGQTWEGTYASSTGQALDAASADPRGPPGNMLGTIITAMMFIALAAATFLAVLWLRERRFRDYLVRRLFEETKGRLPAHWPEHHFKAEVARLMARGKN